ncbi:2OG-Fe dioxygenase family protein [Rickettsiales bacterium LUAb2]
MINMKVDESLNNVQVEAVNKINEGLQLNGFEYVPTITSFLPIESSECTKFKVYWDDMSKDQYVEDFTNRFRRMARFISTKHGLEIDHTNTVKTSKKYNPIAGGVVREYEYASQGFIKNLYFQKILSFNNTLARQFLKHEELVITCHLFRISPNDDKNDAPITIGKHKDDTELIGLHFINGQNFQGGHSSLYTNDGKLVDNSTVTLSKFGETVYIDDIALLHETTSIQKKDSNLEAFRDVLLFMINSKEKHIEKMS